MSFVFGGLTAFDTLGSQAYGAGNFKHVGVLAQVSAAVTPPPTLLETAAVCLQLPPLQRALCICTLLCLPISLSWIFATKPVLMLVGIEEQTADLAQVMADSCNPYGESLM